MEKPIELTNDMTQQERIAAQNVNNAKNGTLINRVEQNENKLNNITDSIVESGTSGIWTYIKRASGTAECWGTITYNNAGSALYGAIYSCNVIADINFPFTFLERPQVFPSVQESDWWYISNTCTNEKITNVWLGAAGAGTRPTLKVDVNVKGRWK